MGNYEQLKQSVSDVIKTNGNQEITGSILQNVLLTIISSVGANATFAGVATPTTNPGTPDGPVFYLAFESGTYSNFNAIELQDELSVLMWNGSWSTQPIFSIDDIPTAGSDNLVKSGGIYAKIKAIEDAGYVFAGIATPTTNPDMPDQNVFYIASEAGTYTNFGGAELQDGLSLLMWNDSWSSQQIIGVDDVPTAGSDNLVKSGGIYKNCARNIYYALGYNNYGYGLKVELGENNAVTVTIYKKSNQFLWFSGGTVRIDNAMPEDIVIEFTTEDYSIYTIYYNLDDTTFGYVETPIDSVVLNVPTGSIILEQFYTKMGNGFIAFSINQNLHIGFNGDKFGLLSSMKVTPKQLKKINELEEGIENVINREFNQFSHIKTPWVYGASIQTVYNEPVSDVYRAYWNEVQNCVPGDTINVEKSSNKISNVMIRCFDAAQNYLTTLLNEGINTIPNNCTQYFINIISYGGVASLEYLKGEYVIINNVRFIFDENGYINPLQESKDYTDEKISENEYYKNLVGCFERIVCIGDSITAGFTGSSFAGENVGSNTARLTARNWVAYFKKLINSDVINLGYGSTTTTLWRNSTPETEGSNLYCALDLAKIEGTQAYFIMLGWNDNISLGTAADIVSDYNNNGQSFYGNYDNIVRRLHEFNEKAHIFVFTLARSKKDSSYNDAIRYIANLYSYCHLIDYSHNDFFDSNFFAHVADGTHYSPLGYNAFATLVRDLTSKYIYENPDKFAGIPYTADTTLIGNIDVKNFALSSNSITINSLNSYSTLVAEFIPASTSNKSVTWTKVSGDTDCVTLIPNVSTPYCTIKSNSNGTCLIRATDSNGNTDECTVVVNDTQTHVTGITLNEQSVTMSIGDSERTINATVSPDNATNKRVFWRTQSGGDSVITIEANALSCQITPRGVGTDTIIVTTEDGSYVAQCVVIIQ